MTLSKERFEAMREELEGELAKHPDFHLRVPATVMLSVVGNLYLALRHPANNGPSGKLARDFIEQVLAGSDFSERVKTLIRRNDDPNYDR